MMYINILTATGLMFKEPVEMVCYSKTNNSITLVFKIKHDTCSTYIDSTFEFDGVEPVDEKSNNYGTFSIYLSSNKEKVQIWMDGILSAFSILKEFVHE